MDRHTAIYYIARFILNEVVKTSDLRCVTSKKLSNSLTLRSYDKYASNKQGNSTSGDELFTTA